MELLLSSRLWEFYMGDLIPSDVLLPVFLQVVKSISEHKTFQGD